MPDTPDHDVLQELKGRVTTIEGKINGLVPEQCIITREAIKGIQKDITGFRGSIARLGWILVVAVVGIFANLISNNIRWDHMSSAEARQITQIRTGGK